MSQSPNRVQLRCVRSVAEHVRGARQCLNPLTGSNCGVSAERANLNDARYIGLNPLTGSNCGVSGNPGWGRIPRPAGLNPLTGSNCGVSVPTCSPPSGRHSVSIP